MSIGCLQRGIDSGPPPVITDTSTMTVNLDNQGMATLQITILTKSNANITNFCYTFAFSNGYTFKGFIKNDSPRKLEGTEYFEHLITAEGMIC